MQRGTFRYPTAGVAISTRLAVLDSFPLPGLVIPQGNTLPSMAAPSIFPIGDLTLEQFPMTTVPEKLLPTYDRDAYRHALQRPATARCELEVMRVLALERINQIERCLAEIDRELVLWAAHRGPGPSVLSRVDPGEPPSTTDGGTVVLSRT